MATKTLAQMQADGFELIRGSGERFQIWTGAEAGTGESVERAWDSQGAAGAGIYKEYKERSAQDAVIMDFACAVTLKDMIDSGVFASVGAPTRNAWKSGLNQAFSPN